MSIFATFTRLAIVGMLLPSAVLWIVWYGLSIPSLSWRRGILRERGWPPVWLTPQFRGYKAQTWKNLPDYALFACTPSCLGRTPRRQLISALQFVEEWNEIQRLDESFLHLLDDLKLELENTPVKAKK